MRKNQLIIDKISDLDVLTGEIKTIEGDVIKEASVRIDSKQAYETTVWVSGVEKVVGDRVIANVDNNHEYRCLVEGTTGGSEPNWPINGGTVEDGVDIIWQDLGIYDPGTLLECVRFYYHCSPDNTDDGHQAFNVTDMVLVAEEGLYHHIIGFADLLPRACEKAILAGTWPGARVFRSVDLGLTWEDMGSLYNSNFVLNTGVWSKPYILNETIVGGTSGAQGKVLGMLPDNYLIFRYLGDLTKKFAESELIIGVTSEAVSTSTTIVLNHDYGIVDLTSMGDTGLVIGGVYSQITLAGNITRSPDKGLSWIDLGVILGAQDIYSAEYLGNGVCLAGSNPMGRVFKSVDFGLNWVDKGTLDSQTPACVTGFANLGGGVCLASTYWYNSGTSTDQGSIYKSSNWGDSWSKVFGVETDLSYYIEDVHYLENGICLAGGGKRGMIWRSTDYGSNWLSTSETAYGLYIVEFTYLGNGICLAGGSNDANLFRSINYGLSWSNLGEFYGITRIIALEYLGNGVCLLGGSIGFPGSTGAKILRSTNYGLNWSDMGVSYGELGVNTIVRLGM